MNQAKLDTIHDLMAENERLSKENIILSQNADTAFEDGLNEAQDLYAEQVKAEIKAEAIKEFAESLKEELRLSTGNNGGFVPSMIDILVKEKAGDTE